MAKLIAFPKPRKSKSKAPPPQLTMPAICSFLKDTRGLVTWTPSDLAKTLGATTAQANEAIPLLAMQGYINASEHNRWMTTLAGERLSGSVPPRFESASVEHALAALQERIRELNKNAAAEFSVARAVAFGDFLGHASRVQAAGVGLLLKRRGEQGSPVAEREAEDALFTSLRARSPMLHLVRFADWMSGRTHRKLI